MSAAKMTFSEKLVGLIICFITLLVIPVFLVYLTSQKFYDDFLVSVANKVFLNKYGQQYQGFFAYLLGATVTPFILALGIAICSSITPFIVPGSIVKKATNKQRILVVSITFALFFIAVFSIPITHYPDIIRDYNCVKRGVTRQIETDQYNTYMKMEHGGRVYTRYPVYYISFKEDRGNKTINKTFSIGRDLYNYLEKHPKENIIINYMPNTGIFLNIQIGDEKFGTYSEESQ